MRSCLRSKASISFWLIRMKTSVRRASDCCFIKVASSSLSALSCLSFNLPCRGATSRSPRHGGLVSHCAVLVAVVLKCRSSAHQIPLSEAAMNKKRQKLRGTVQKVIKPIVPGQVEKAEIDVKGADPLYREIRIENVVVDAEGKKAALKQGAEVAVIVEADSSATTTKPDI